MRFLRFSRQRLALAVVAAVSLTALVVLFHRQLLEAHFALSAALLQLAAIPVQGNMRVGLYGGLSTAPAPVVAAFPLQASPWYFGILFTIALLGLWVIRRTVRLASGFIAFTVVLLVMTAALIVWQPQSQFGAVEFTQMWLRGEMLVWLLLPWFTAGVLLLVYPVAAIGLTWGLAAQVFGFLWSVVRLSFCIGVLHYTGFLFIPLLWFTLGILADVMYLLVGLSAVIHWLAERYWGRRRLWEF